MIPTVSPIVIDTAMAEWFRLNTDPFKFCIAQIEAHRQSNPHLLASIDDLLGQVYIVNEVDSVPSDVREVNRARAFAVILLVLKMVGAQLEVDELYKIYNS